MKQAQANKRGRVIGVIPLTLFLPTLRIIRAQFGVAADEHVLGELDYCHYQFGWHSTTTVNPTPFDRVLLHS